MKHLLPIMLALVLAACSDEMDESKYTMSVQDAQSEISLALNEVMLCKGFAMQNRPVSEVQKCLDNYFEKYGSSYDTAAKEFFARAQESKDFKESETAKVMLKKIAMQQEGMKYITKWMEKQ